MVTIICVLALIVFGILGIFSASYRSIAKEAFNCVFLKVTLRKCRTGLDKRLRTQLTGTVMKHSPKAASFLYRHFEVFSWLFLILTVLTLAGLAYGGYNYYLYGTCNGPGSEGFCVFDPTGEHTGTSAIGDEDACSVPELRQAALNLDEFDYSLYPGINRGSMVTLVEIGCYGCQFTQKAQPNIQHVVDSHGINFVFAHFPVKTSIMVNVQDYCMWQLGPALYWEVFSQHFAAGPDHDHGHDLHVDLTAGQQAQFDACFASDEALAFAEQQVENIRTTGVYGTPTVFIVGPDGPENAEAVVGPKPKRVYDRLIKRAMKGI